MKNSKFKLGVLAYAGILVVLIVVLLIYTWNSMKKYEASQPSNVVEKLVEKIEKGDFSDVNVGFSSKYETAIAADLLKTLGIKLIEPKPALCAICCDEKDIYELSGLSFKNICATLPNKKQLFGDFLITHSSLSGPLAYKISSVYAYEKFPYKILLNFIGLSAKEFDKKLIEDLNINSKKDVINIIAEYVPRSFAKYLLRKNNLKEDLKANQVSKVNRVMLVQQLTNYNLNIISQKADGEIVTAGGVDLDYVNAKTMEYKEIKGLYFCGEVLNIDGFTGGFNLQNCWSTGYIAGKSI